MGMQLGCINHALLTAEAIRRDGLKLAGWVANCPGELMPCYEENLATLQRWLPAPLLGEVPYLDPFDAKIAQKYLLPKVRRATGLGEDQLVFTDDVWPFIIRPLGFDAGIRELERTLTKIEYAITIPYASKIHRHEMTSSDIKSKKRIFSITH